ncbi:hypothetical protein C5167_018520 [Papaver somniferum]|uniref:Beta-ketoacyl synthase C-terminal domain-containing protein n=1 Tax=Papaver somniferum TaxID=3469 RepID=A0A4Y7IMH1_PAPSO|nr:hypothetical protein C5167_018520 [Papaver somniferum]
MSFSRKLIWVIWTGRDEMREYIATGLVVAEEEVAGAGSDAVGVVLFWMLQGRRSGDCMAKIRETNEELRYSNCWQLPLHGSIKVEALAQFGVSREDVNYVNAHATSTQAGDLKEY